MENYIDKKKSNFKKKDVLSIINKMPGGHIQKKFDIESNQTIVITENYNKTES